MQTPHFLAQVGAMNPSTVMQTDDTSSDSTGSGIAPVVPTTLNIEEW